MSKGDAWSLGQSMQPRESKEVDEVKVEHVFPKSSAEDMLCLTDNCKLVIVMVGKAARGKTVLCGKLSTNFLFFYF